MHVLTRRFDNNLSGHVFNIGGELIHIRSDDNQYPSGITNRRPRVQAHSWQLYVLCALALHLRKIKEQRKFSLQKILRKNCGHRTQWRQASSNHTSQQLRIITNLHLLEHCRFGFVSSVMRRVANGLHSAQPTAASRARVRVNCRVCWLCTNPMLEPSSFQKCV